MKTFSGSPRFHRLFSPASRLFLACLTWSAAMIDARAAEPLRALTQPGSPALTQPGSPALTQPGSQSGAMPVFAEWNWWWWWLGYFNGAGSRGNVITLCIVILCLSLFIMMKKFAPDGRPRRD